MNDKDKEAFDAYWINKNYGFQTEVDTALGAWLSACEYMRSKSTPLDALSLYEKLEKEREENKKLRDALNHYANKYCWQGTHIGPSDYWFDDTQGYWLGGKRAREALKEVGEE